MKIKEYMAVLFNLIHEDNEVSAFFVFEEAVKVFHKSRNSKHQELAACIDAIIEYVAKIENTIYGSYDVHRLYGYRTVEEYIDGISKASLAKQQSVDEEIGGLRESVERFSELVWNFGDIDANGNEIDAWVVESVPEEAFHPVSEWLFV